MDNKKRIEDIKARVSLLPYVESHLGPPVKRSGAWALFYCPFHPNTNTPAMGVNAASNSWRCFGACGTGGDVIQFARLLFPALSFAEILDLLDGANLQDKLTNRAQPAQVKLQKSDPYPGPEWARAAARFVADCQVYLYGESGARVLDYLGSRGIRSPEIIRLFRLGYNPGDRFDNPELWGLPSGPGAKKVFIPRGLVIPWIAMGRIWGINIRRPAGDPKYLQIKGSRPAVFGYDNLPGGDYAILTEGELDCILLTQEAGDFIGVGSLGSASHGSIDLSLWPALLGLRGIWYAGDRDLAGLQGTKRLESLSHRIRRAALPAECAGKDLTDYYRAGGDLAVWAAELIRPTVETMGVAGI